MFYVQILPKVEDCEAESVILFSGKYCIFIFVSPDSNLTYQQHFFQNLTMSSTLLKKNST